MKPADHPEFFRFPPPEGRSRESALRIDAEGRFFDHDELVEHPKLAAALHTWIARHPDDGRFILTNGYDWSYFKVDDVPYFVRSVRAEGVEEGVEEGNEAARPDGPEAVLVLSDGTEEMLEPSTLRLGDHGEVYLKVKGGAFDAKMTRHAQTQLDPFLSEEAGEVVLTTARGRVRLPIG